MARLVNPPNEVLRDRSEGEVQNPPDVASLGYPVTYSIGNVLLTIWGPIVVAIVHAWRH